MNGYSCIDKHIVPGLAFCRSIEQNHKLALHHHDAVAGKNSWHKDPSHRENPFYQDNREARAMSEKVWYNESTGTMAEQKIITLLKDEVVAAGGFIPEHDPQRWITERAARKDGKIRFVDEANKLCALGK